MMNQLSPERLTKVETRAAELIAEEITLQDLRKARELTQERMAELLGISQNSVSRIEKQSDLLLSTLRSYIAAMGGNLEIIVRFPDRPSVALYALAGEEEQPAHRTRRARSTANDSKKRHTG